MSPGSIVYQFRSRFEHGLHVAYARDVLRSRILSTPPMRGLNDSTAEIHVMTSKDDWLNLIWTLKSFYHYGRRRYRLCIHEDGSLDAGALGQFQRHFPDARIIRRIDADRRMVDELAGYPRCLEFRRTNLLSPKVFDFVTFLTGNRLLILDSDLLFFRKPTVLVDRIDDPSYRVNTFNCDGGFGYAITPDVVREHLGLELMPEVNSGLGLVHRASMRWDWVEQFLGLPGLLQGHSWRIEQTLIALCSSRYGVELLPDEYTLHLGRGIGSRPFRHYVGRIRYLMYSEGMCRLIREGFLAELSR